MVYCNWGRHLKTQKHIKTTQSKLVNYLEVEDLDYIMIDLQDFAKIAI